MSASTDPRNEEKTPERKIDTVANSRDKGGDTKAKQLRSDSHHYCEKNKDINTLAASLNPSCPYPLRLIPMEAPRTPQAV